MAPAQNILIGSGYSCSKVLLSPRHATRKGRAVRNGKNKIYDMGRIVKTVRMVPAGAANNFYRASSLA